MKEKGGKGVGQLLGKRKCRSIGQPAVFVFQTFFTGETDSSVSFHFFLGAQSSKTPHTREKIEKSEPKKPQFGELIVREDH